MVLLLASILFAILYASLQFYYLHFWKRIPAIVLPEHYVPSTGISVIVVAHNEEKTVGKNIRSIIEQHYPAELFELIIIDDRSEDETASIISQFEKDQIKYFRLVDFPEWIHPPAYKKSGIDIGVHHALHEFIVVTDADCTHDRNWLRTLSYAYEKQHASFLTGPIRIVNAESQIERLQQIEYHALMVITGAGIQSGLHAIANGANMAFSKKAFLDVKGYHGNYNHASGDDMFLIEKMNNHFPGQVSFVKSGTACVYTNAKKDWDSLISQRLRWAGKNKGLQSHTISRIWMFIGFYHLLMVLLFVLSFIDLTFLLAFIIMLAVKWISDLLLIRQASLFLKTQLSWLDFIILQPFYTFYLLRLGWHMLLGRKGDW